MILSIKFHNVGLQQSAHRENDGQHKEEYVSQLPGIRPHRGGCWRRA